MRAKMAATESPAAAKSWTASCLSCETYEEEVERIIHEIDYYDNGEINYTEFLVATLDM